MATAFDLSPPKKAPEKVVREDSSISKSFLVLGAFSSVPKLHFEEVPLGKTKRKILVIRNPGDKGCFLRICKLPPSTFAVSIDNSIQQKDEDILVSAAGEVHVDIAWTPKEQGQFFETLQLLPSTGGTKLSVHLLGKCTPPPKGQANRKRPGGQSTVPKPTQSAIGKVASELSTEPKFSASRVTLPKSPNFSTRLSTRTPSSKSEGETKAKSSAPLSALASSKIAALSLPFTPEPDHSKVSVRNCESPTEFSEFGLMLPPGSKDEHFGLGKPESHHRILMAEEMSVSDVSSPSRRETYSLPTPSVPLVTSPAENLAENDVNGSDVATDAVPPLESKPSPVELGSSDSHDVSTGGIELDAALLENISKALDNDLEQVHKSVDSMLDFRFGATHKAALTALNNLTNLDEEAIIKSISSLDSDEDNRRRNRGNSAECLCLDSKDLSPCFPANDVKVDTELVAGIKRLLSDGKDDSDIMQQYCGEDRLISEDEIRVLYGEIANKYNSYRQCFESLKTCYLSENFITNRNAIHKAVNCGRVRLREGVNIFENNCKIPIITNLLTEYCRSWLWSALCLVFHDDKLEADDIDIMTFIDESLFHNDEFEDFLYEPVSKAEEENSFLKHYLEIVYLLDETGIASIFATSSSSKHLLQNFETKYLDSGSIESLLSTCPVKLMQKIDPMYFLMQQNLLGKDLFAWTNIVALIQELSVKPICLLEEQGNLSNSSIGRAVELVKSALEEAKEQGIECDLPDMEYSDIIFGAANVNMKFLSDAVVKVRLSQCKKAKKEE